MNAICLLDLPLRFHSYRNSGTLTSSVTADELRRDYIHAHGVALHAMGLAGHSLLEKHPRDWKKCLKNLESIDWSRTNSKTWEGRATIGGVVSKARTNLMLTANYLKKVLDLPLTAEEQKLEKLVRPKLKLERAIVHAG